VPFRECFFHGQADSTSRQIGRTIHFCFVEMARLGPLVPAFFLRYLGWARVFPRSPLPLELISLLGSPAGSGRSLGNPYSSQHACRPPSPPPFQPARALSSLLAFLPRRPLLDWGCSTVNFSLPAGLSAALAFPVRAVGGYSSHVPMQTASQWIAGVF